MKARHLVLVLLVGFATVEAAAQTAPLPPLPPGAVFVDHPNQRAPRKNIPAIARDANGAIVTIVMANNDKPIAQGTGFVVASNGVIVTNYHVIETGNVAVVKFPDGTILSVDGVLTADKLRDLAIVKVHGKTFRTLTLGNSDRIQVGEEVVAIGNPLGLELTVSNGIISGMRTDEKLGGKFLQSTAPISPGSSGGPLFNMQGEVVGINTSYLEGGENLNFAIPSNDVKNLLSVHQDSKLQKLPNESDAVNLSEIDKNVQFYETMDWIDKSWDENHQEAVHNGRLCLTKVVYDQGDGMGVETSCLNVKDDHLEDENQSFEILTFNLRDIDPDSLSFKNTSSGRINFTARTTNDELKIEAHQFKPQNQINKINSITFDLDSDYGPRFMKAFKQAVILDGGKPSMY